MASGGSIRGMPGLRAELARLGQVAQRVADDTVADWSATVRDDAKSRVAVLTGTLRAAIETRAAGGHTAEVGVWRADALYAQWVELGNSRQAPQPFLGPAAAATDAAAIVTIAKAALARQGLR